jgi:hypothetical protein
MQKPPRSGHARRQTIVPPLVLIVGLEPSAAQA